MSWESCKTVDSSVAIEIGIMDTSKKPADYDQVFEWSENYKLFIIIK